MSADCSHFFARKFPDFLIFLQHVAENFVKFQEKSATFWKNPRKSGNFREKNCENSAKFEIGAVQKNANLVRLEKC